LGKSRPKLDIDVGCGAADARVNSPAAVSACSTWKDDVAIGRNLDLIRNAQQVDKPGDRVWTDFQQRIARLAEHPNIPGMKETSNDLERLGQFAALAPDRFRVFIGWAPVVYPALVSGATGAILAVANVLPDACVTLYNHVRSGRHSDALALQQRLTHVAQLVTSVHGVAGLKAAMEQVGHYGGPVRAPLLAAGDKARHDVEQALRAFAG